MLAFRDVGAWHPLASEVVMSGDREARIPVELWSLPRTAEWIETREDDLQRSIQQTTVRELHEALKAGTIAASGCVDGGERRAISPAEWHDYRLTLEHAAFLDYYHLDLSGMAVIAVLSIRSFPAAALKYHGNKSRDHHQLNRPVANPATTASLMTWVFATRRGCATVLHWVVPHQPLLHRRGADQTSKRAPRNR